MKKNTYSVRMNIETDLTKEQFCSLLAASGQVKWIDIYDRPVTDELDSRSMMGLKNMIRLKSVTPKQVAKLTTADILREPNMGRKCLLNIERWLMTHGLRLKEEG